MKRAWIMAVAYTVSDLLVFAAGYYILKIRELGLYLFLVGVGSPASWLVVPGSERLAERFDWPLGSIGHVWACAVASALLNAGVGLVIAGIVRSARSRRQYGRAV